MVMQSLHDSFIRWVEDYRKVYLHLRFSLWIFMPLSRAVPLDVTLFNYTTNVRIRLIKNEGFDSRST